MSRVGGVCGRNAELPGRLPRSGHAAVACGGFQSRRQREELTGSSRFAFLLLLFPAGLASSWKRRLDLPGVTRLRFCIRLFRRGPPPTHPLPRSSPPFPQKPEEAAPAPSVAVTLRGEAWDSERGGTSGRCLPTADTDPPQPGLSPSARPSEHGVGAQMGRWSRADACFCL